MQPANIPDEELKRLYTQELKNQDELAELYGCSQATIHNRLIKLGIQLRSKATAQRMRNQDPQKRNQGRPGESNPNYKHGGYIADRIYHQLIERRSCAECGSRQQLIVHHGNGNHEDNALGNLTVLCHSCHSRLHKTTYWQDKLRAA